MVRKKYLLHNSLLISTIPTYILKKSHKYFNYSLNLKQSLLLKSSLK